MLHIFLSPMAQIDMLSIDKLEGANNCQIWKYEMAAILEAREWHSHLKKLKKGQKLS